MKSKHTSPKSGSVEASELVRQSAKLLAGMDALEDALRKRGRFYDVGFVRRHTKLDPETGCWIAQYGYGRYVRINVGGNQIFLLHRFVWSIFNGPIPTGLCACHKCDDNKCWNPEHIFIGTQADNMKDCARKLRSAFGERSARHKLTNEDVLAIRASNERNYILARRYPVNKENIGSIKLGRTWKHLLPFNT